MSINKWIAVGIGILRVLFTLYIFFCFFDIFLGRKKRGVRVTIGILILVAWQIDIFETIRIVPIEWNIVVSMGFTLLAVLNIFEGKFIEKCFFSIIFDALWMLVETLVGNLLMIYCEPIADSMIIGSFGSKLLFLVVVIALKKVFMKEEIQELSGEYGVGFIFIPIGSIYIMNAVFVLVDETNEILSSGGFIIQLLPEATEEDISYIEEKIKDFPAVSSLIHEGKTPEEILKMIFDDVEITDRQDLFFTCDCSREKMINALSTIGKQELQSMIDEDHGCEITCQFCNTKYQFSEEELQNLINRL